MPNPKKEHGVQTTPAHHLTRSTTPLDHGGPKKPPSSSRSTVSDGNPSSRVGGARHIHCKGHHMYTYTKEYTTKHVISRL
jgi:hypothetical protein